ncbi:alternative oxidase-domain-containing protein [Gymnopilus junonius]|uniref:Alternative oxidase n=1 Tax=Gymnopilus junonius TaxID=109634 RepID=A0A9P5TIP6_GYMJU|nr:alternative oxidase-domain-containing protein [Gymnopilus junonius]
MLRTAVVKTSRPAFRLGLVAPCLAASPPCLRSAFLVVGTSAAPAARHLSTSSARSNDDLTSRSAIHAATEKHKQDLPGSSSSATSLITKQSHTVHTIPDTIQGDWVLFHPVYSKDEMTSVEVLHRVPTTFSDSLAHWLVKTARTIFDWVVGYKHIETPPTPDMTIEQLRKAGYLLTEKQWLDRILFLESIAGVPGMVAATLRHLTSLRLMRRDKGWIHTCLEEAENERMHLMTFMHIRKPGMFFRLLVLGAQGVFYNLFFLVYTVSPRSAHRFVGYLEEEAVVTYTRCIHDLEAGKIPEWTDFPAPEIAIDYWRLQPNAKLLDVIYAVRSDETTHRFVNHTLANLNSDTDVNPFALREPDMHVKGKTLGFERSESEEYVKESREIIEKHAHEVQAEVKV